MTVIVDIVTSFNYPVLSYVFTERINFNGLGERLEFYWKGKNISTEYQKSPLSRSGYIVFLSNRYNQTSQQNWNFRCVSDSVLVYRKQDGIWVKKTTSPDWMVLMLKKDYFRRWRPTQ